MQDSQTCFVIKTTLYEKKFELHYGGIVTLGLHNSSKATSCARAETERRVTEGVAKKLTSFFSGLLSLQLL
jgi:hypothetical protein